MRPHGSAAELERRRRQAIALADQGCSSPEIAQRLGTTRQSVNAWRRAYAKGGAAALAAEPAPGRPSRLSARQRRGLVTRLLKGARANGFATDLWTCGRITELIDRCYGVQYHPDHMCRLLPGLGFSCQKPERQALERDEEAIAGWQARQWPRIKKSRTSPGTPCVHR